MQNPMLSRNLLKTRLLAVLALSLATVAQAADVPSEIVKVELFSGQARITRSFEVSLKQGEQTSLRFVGLPQGAQLENAQITVEQGGELSFGRITWDNNFNAEDESDRLRELRARKDEVAAGLARLSERRLALNARVKHLGDMVTSLHAGLAKTGKLELYETAKQAWEDQQKAVEETAEAVRELDKQIWEVQRDQKEAERLYNERLQQEQRAASELMVATQALRGGRTQGTLSYVVSGANWTPSYIVRAEPSARNVELVYQAVVWQQTGEDWNDVELVLNTGRPALGGEPLEPPVVFLSRYLPQANASADVRYGSAVPTPISTVDDVFIMGLKEANMRESLHYEAGVYTPPTTALSASTVGFQARLPMAVTVESGKPEAVFPIVSGRYETEFWTVTIPLSSETAYLAGKFDNGLSLPLLPGKAQLFVDGTLNGVGRVELTQPGQEIELGLGQNQNIEVERTVLGEKGDTKGIISKSRVEQRRYQTKLTNNMAVPQRIVLKDRVPISRDDSIKVELISPKKMEIDPETGLFEYEVTLQPGASVEVLTHFKVTYPSDWAINGDF